MSNRPDVYKLYQVMSYLTLTHGYKGIVMKGSVKSDEIWMVNRDTNVYPIIRITMASMDSVDYDLDRLSLCIRSIASQVLIDEPTFLDIHIGKGEVSDHEEYSTICLDQDYFSGVNVDNIFPGIRNVIHPVADPSQEIKSIFEDINRNAILSRKNRKKWYDLKGRKNLCTLVIMILCILNFLLYLYLSSKFDASASYIVLGADYKPFTLGLHEFYRLLTVAFSHGSVMHLFSNMYSLYFLGSYVESKYGHLNFLLALVLSILCGSLTAGIMSASPLKVGISGGLYGLMIIYIMETAKGGIYAMQRLYPLIIINLAINFYPTVAWQAHLGGAIMGFLFEHYLKTDKKEKVPALLLCFVLIAGLTYKFYSATTLDFYPGTDMDVIGIYRNLGMQNTVDYLEKALIRAYQSFK